MTISNNFLIFCLFKILVIWYKQQSQFRKLFFHLKYQFFLKMRNIISFIGIINQIIGKNMSCISIRIGNNTFPLFSMDRLFWKMRSNVSLFCSSNQITGKNEGRITICIGDNVPSSFSIDRPFGKMRNNISLIRISHPI